MKRCHHFPFPFSFHFKFYLEIWEYHPLSHLHHAPLLLGCKMSPPSPVDEGLPFMCTCGHTIAQLRVCLDVYICLGGCCVGTRAHMWYVHVLEIIACLCKSVYYYNLKSRRPKWMYRVTCTKIITDCFSPCGKALQRRGRTEGSWVFWGLSVDL